jgi:hypothetical protein
MHFKFIKTYDEQTRDKLLENGHQLISQNGNECFFVYNSILKFDGIETNKIQYTNILNV